VPQDAKSFRVTCDRAGRWHVAFAVIPEPVPAPGTGDVAGIDRGVAVSAALSTGELLHAPGLAARERRRLQRLERKLARVHEPALLGVRAHRSGQPREPSPVPLRGLRLRLQR
jgi:transposase